MVIEESYFLHLRGRARSETLPDVLALRGRGVVLNHQAPLSRDSDVHSFRLFPGESCLTGDAVVQDQKKTTGGVGNGYFGSGECGFDSRRDWRNQSRGLTVGHPTKSAAVCSPVTASTDDSFVQNQKKRPVA